MARKEVSYQELADKLGVPKHTVQNKINRGKFKAAFFVQVLQALNLASVPIPKEFEEQY